MLRNTYLGLCLYKTWLTTADEHFPKYGRVCSVPRAVLLVNIALSLSYSHDLATSSERDVYSHSSSDSARWQVWANGYPQKGHVWHLNTSFIHKYESLFGISHISSIFCEVSIFQLGAFPSSRRKSWTEKNHAIHGTQTVLGMRNTVYTFSTYTHNE